MSGQRKEPRGSAALRRKQPIHLSPFESWDTPTIIFVTCCTDKRKPILANPSAHKLIVDAWQGAHEWRVGRYVVMPNHIHFFCSPASAEAQSLEKWMQYWKALVTKRWPDISEKPIWQPDHWDRQLRRADSYGNKWDYVRWNPVRHKLCVSPEEWPFQGELSVLSW